MKRRKSKSNTTTSPRIYGYIRVSTNETKQKHSPAVQRHAIEKLIAPGKVTNWFKDEASGSVEPLKRPGLSELLEVIRKGDVLAVAHHDRLARKMLWSAWLFEEADRRKFTILSAAGGNGDSDEVVLMREVMAAFAGHEKRRIQKRIKEALDRKRANGERCSRYIPYGYKLRGKKKLVPVPAQQRTIKKIIGWHRKGWSLRKMRDRLDKLGVKPARAKQWNIITIRAIIRRAEEGRSYGS